jgi:hypothetical protein
LEGARGKAEVTAREDRHTPGTVRLCKLGTYFLSLWTTACAR